RRRHPSRVDPPPAAARLRQGRRLHAGDAGGDDRRGRGRGGDRDPRLRRRPFDDANDRADPRGYPGRSRTMTRRGSGSWAQEAVAEEPEIDVLVPFAGRSAALAVTLAGLAAQDGPPFRVIISDQSLNGEVQDPAVRAMLRVLCAQ